MDSNSIQVKEIENNHTMCSADLLQNKDSSKRNISSWHLYAIYGLLTLCILMGVLCLASLLHLNRRQKDIEMKLDSSGCVCFDARQSVKDKSREPSSDSDSQDENVDEDDVDERQALVSGAYSAYTGATTKRASKAVSESSQERRSEMVLQRSPRNADASSSALSLRNSVEVPSNHNHREPEGDLTSFPNGLSNSSESSATVLSGRDLLTRLPRQTRGRDQDDDQQQERKQKATTKKSAERKRNRRIRQREHENTSRVQGMEAIHLQAPDHMERQYESGPMISINASYTKDTVYRFWRKASWVRDSVAEVFHLDETTGHVTVEIEGLYMIYAQMVYHDLSGRWSFGIYVGDQEKVKCLATEQLRDLHSYHPTSHGVYQNCYTAIVLHIRKNQSVSIRCMYGSRTILTRPEFTFWGMIRLS